MKSRSRSAPRSIATRLTRVRRSWLDFSDRELLRLRLSDLELSIDDSPLAPRIRRLHEELEARAIFHRPHAWLSTSWFSPDGVAGIAIPFYLAHPRLTRLEELETGEVEGRDAQSCMKLLRHECGHAIDSAYRLHQKRSWRDTFGRYSANYRPHYTPRPFRREFVLHLDHWYAQSHAAEDFAETFAVWLDPKSRWREHYGDWPAIAKLEYVERRMEELAGAPAPETSREEPWSIESLDWTLARYYAAKRARYGARRIPSVDRVLRDHLRPFDAARANSPRRHFASLRRELERRASHADFEERYTLEQVLRTLVRRAHELELTVDARDPKRRLEAFLSLGHVLMRSFRSGRHKLLR